MMHAMIVCRRSLLLLYLCTGLLAVGFTLGQAHAFDHWTTGLAGYQAMDKDVAHYAARARPERSAPHLTANGSWVVETDKNTGLTEPRLLSLANGRSVTRVNHALQAVHGYILQQERVWRHDHDIDEYGPSVVPGLLTVTYFSPTTFSYVVRGEQLTQGSMRLPIVRGTTLDIESGTISTVASCDGSGPFFKFGRLLTVCDNARLHAFRDLWKEQARTLQRTVPRRVDEWDEWCRKLTTFYIDIQDEQLGHNFGFEFSLYLTPTGLAVHQAFGVSGAEERCILDSQSPFLPTIIPWQKLAPLMNPGPLRNELLSLQ